jgi:septal ring factor EnvC (AmiA/AmiB activator)
MNTDEKIVEICEKIAKLEKTVNNGLSEDITEIKDSLKEIKKNIDTMNSGIISLKTGQNIQWFLIATILAGLITLFLRR